MHNHRGTAFHYSQYREIFMGIHRRTKVITAVPWIFSRLSLSRDICLTSVLSHLYFYLSHFVPFTFPLITSWISVPIPVFFSYPRVSCDSFYLSISENNFFDTWPARMDVLKFIKACLLCSRMNNCEMFRRIYSLISLNYIIFLYIIIIYIYNI